jgi:hypothetical protein
MKGYEAAEIQLLALALGGRNPRTPPNGCQPPPTALYLSPVFGFMFFSILSEPVVLYGCETWSLTLREERRLRVFENRMLRRVFGPKRDEVTGEW